MRHVLSPKAQLDWSELPASPKVTPSQANATVKPAPVSAADGSVGSDRLTVTAPPSSMGPAFVRVADGGTFSTRTTAVYSVKPSSFSMMRPRTVTVPLSS